MNYFSTVFEIRKAVSKILFDTQPYCDKPILEAINIGKHWSIICMIMKKVLPRTDSFLQLHNSTLILLKVSKVVPKLSNVYIFTDSVPSAKIEDSPDLEAKKLVMNFYLKETCNVPLTKTFRQKISHNIKKGKCNYTDFTSDLYICFSKSKS